MFGYRMFKTYFTSAFDEVLSRLVFLFSLSVSLQSYTATKKLGYHVASVKSN